MTYEFATLNQMHRIIVYFEFIRVELNHRKSTFSSHGRQVKLTKYRFSHPKYVYISIELQMFANICVSVKLENGTVCSP